MEAAMTIRENGPRQNQQRSEETIHALAVRGRNIKTAVGDNYGKF
jgi:hypothetical protein